MWWICRLNRRSFGKTFQFVSSVHVVSDMQLAHYKQLCIHLCRPIRLKGSKIAALSRDGFVETDLFDFVTGLSNSIGPNVIRTYVQLKSFV